MFCIICTLPVQNSEDENRLCQSCALELETKDYCDEEALKDFENLDNLQKKLLFDLHLEGDSDYEVELEYLMQVKRGKLLNQQRNLRSSKSNESVTEDIHKLSSSDERKKHQAVNEVCAVKSEILEFKPEFCNGNAMETKRKNDFTTIQNSYTNLECFKEPKNNLQKLPEVCDDDSQPLKEKPRRVSINHSNVFTFSQKNTANHCQSSIAHSCKAVIRPKNKCCEPPAQFENIHSHQFQSDSINVNELLSNVYKNPFMCPVTSCKNIVPVSDFIKHFKLNHIRVPIVTMNPGACTNLFWDVKVDQFGISNCLMLLLTTGKVKPFAYGQYRDYLPIVIMTTKVKIMELAADFECDRENAFFYMIWLTSICTQDAQISYTISAWSEIDDNQNGVLLVNTNQLYSLRDDQNPMVVYRSGNAMILTKEQIRKLTHGSEESCTFRIDGFESQWKNRAPGERENWESWMNRKNSDYFRTKLIFF